MAASCRGRSCASLAAAALGMMWMNLHAVWGATFTVGDGQGWNLGVSYSSWAARKTFRGGDVLIFSYTQLHSVVEVSQSDFASCTINPINTYSSGNDSVVLSSTKSVQYFICGTGGHCNGGMALQITIASSASAPAPAKAPTPSAPVPTKAPAPSAPVPVPAKAPAPAPPSLAPSPKPETPESTPASEPAPVESPGAAITPATSPPGGLPRSPTPPAAAPAGSSAFSLAASSSLLLLLTSLGAMAL